MSEESGWMAADPVAYAAPPARSGVGAGMGIDQLYKNLEGFVRQYGNSDAASGQWVNSLDPQARAMWDRHISDLNAKKTDRKKTGQGIALGLLGAGAGSMALGPLLSGSGLLGGSTPSAATLGGAEAGLGYGGYGGAGGTVAGQGGLLGGTGVASGASSLGSLGVKAASALGSIASTPGMTSSLLGMLTAAASNGNKQQPASAQFGAVPGMQFGKLQQSGPMGPMGQMTPAQGQPGLMANSGLARYGANSGRYTVNPYKPTTWNWGQ